MKVLLIQPSNDDLYNPAYWPPLGVLYLAAALQAYGHKVKVVDMALDPLPSSSYHPDLIGISCTTPNYLAVKSIISICHQRWSNTPVVVGGPHISILPSDGPRLGADITVAGDGEAAMIDIAFGLEKGYKFNPLTPISSPVDVNVWPIPARSTIQLNRYGARELGRSSTSLVTARGCPYTCSYCCKWPGYERVRYRSIHNVIQEVEQLKSMGYGSLRFFDDEFNLSEKRLLSMCEAIRPLAIEWTCLIRSNLFTSTQARAMSDAGCRMVQVGVETGSDQILSAMNKRCSVEDNTNCRSIAKEAGLRFWAFFVVGLPGESPSTLQQTREWILSNHPDLFSVYTFQPFPGTQIHNSHNGFDIRFPHPLPYDQFPLGIRGTDKRPLHCLISTSSLTSEQIVEARRYLDVDVRKEAGL